MKETLLELFQDHAQLAVIISLIVSILIAILGILPSVFITAANILFFGFWNGLLLSFAGEALGAIISFLLYRKGFRKSVEGKLYRFPSVQKLLMAENREAFTLILSLRLLPFVPSGLVTFAAAVGKVSATVFVTASSIGKIPALLLEGWSVQEVTRFEWQGKLILAIASVCVAFIAIRSILARKKKGIS